MVAMRSRPISAVALGLLATAGLLGCSSSDDTTEPEPASTAGTTAPATSAPVATGPSTTATTTAPAPTTTEAAAGRYREPVFAAVDVFTATYATGLADLVTGEPVELRLDVYEPAGDTEAQRPLIVWIHGGGFAAGSRETLADVATAYARLGYVTASIDYRLDPGNQCQGVQDETVPPDEAEAERARCGRAIQAAQDDSAAAIAWLRGQAGELGIDPTRLAVGGFSAGAVTAVNLAQRQNQSGPTPPESEVSAALAASGCNYFQGSIDAADAPLSMLAAGGDAAVPFACSTATADAAEEAGVAVQRLLYPDESGHAKALYTVHQAEVDAAWQEFLVVHLRLG
jgi:acetyl esterase/lipase